MNQELNKQQEDSQKSIQMSYLLTDYTMKSSDSIKQSLRNLAMTIGLTVANLIKAMEASDAIKNSNLQKENIRTDIINGITAQVSTAAKTFLKSHDRVEEGKTREKENKGEKNDNRKRNTQAIKGFKN